MESLRLIFTQIGSWFSEVVALITKSGNEILLVPVGIFVFGAVIGLACRLIGRQ